MPPCKLAHVSVEVLYAHLKVGKHVALFQHRPEGLDAIGMSLLLDLFANRVLDEPLIL